MTGAHCCPTEKKQKFDWLLWGSLSALMVLYVLGLSAISSEIPGPLEKMSSSVHELINRMWWGVLIGILMVGLLAKVPREFVLSILGTNQKTKGLIRATAAGVLLDLCSHGILMVGAKLYERGASTGQVMAFLIASPWNSLSLTIILASLIGFTWTLSFVLLSFLVAMVSGALFDKLVASGLLPKNPHQSSLPPDFRFRVEAGRRFRHLKLDRRFFINLISAGLSDSKMVLRWVLFGVVLASVLRAIVSEDQFAALFGPTVLGLLLTIGLATLVEFCSEGSVPIAADIHTRAHSPGNSFAFLMAGVSTDYTEIMVLKECTRSWKLALFLPLVTLPQVLIIGFILNNL